jgi:hypothetical protein
VSSDTWTTFSLLSQNFIKSSMDDYDFSLAPFENSLMFLEHGSPFLKPQAYVFLLKTI